MIKKLIINLKALEIPVVARLWAGNLNQKTVSKAFLFMGIGSFPKRSFPKLPAPLHTF
jgi:hypothetical protein